MEKQRPAAPMWARGILYAVILFLYVPMLVMVINSLFLRDASGWTLTTKWYAEVFHNQTLMQALGRSLIVALASSALATILGALAAVALYRAEFRFKPVLEVFSFVSLLIPELVFALSLLSWFFLLKFPLGLFTVICAHVTFSLSFVMLTVGGRLDSLDESVEDAARDLGAPELRILTSVTLPLLRPALISGFLLSFLLSFDDFLITYFTNGVGTDTLPIKLYAAMKIGLSPMLSALSTLMMVLSVSLILVFLKVRGRNAAL